METAADKEYDLLVTGAGIYGAWAAYDATLRGLKVLIIDKGDIAGATSSASSKLIHGGLRYLEQFNFSLVKKSVKERQKLFELAPHRVKPLTFAIPVYSYSRIPAWKYKIGLTLYDWFASLGSKFKHRSYSPQKFSEKFPFLNTDSLKKGLTYLDAGTDDFRYTFEIVDEAVRLGADLKTYHELISYSESNSKVNSAIIKNLFSSEEIKINFKAAVNATGQWTDPLLDLSACRLSKGVHIVVPNLGTNEALLLLSPIDQRVFFILPWYGKTMIGTTDTDYRGDLNDVKAENSDIDYLLKSANHFLKKQFTQDDIISSFAGLRVLKNENGHPSSVTRDWECREEKPGLYVSLGGKLTSARHDSSIMIDKVCDYLGLKQKCHTNEIPFPWSVPDFTSWKKKRMSEGVELGLSEEAIDLLINRQGKRVDSILKMIKEDNNLVQPIVKDLLFTMAEWRFVLENEYITTFEDLVRRRFPIKLLKKMNSEQLQHLKEIANNTLLEIGKKELKEI